MYPHALGMYPCAHGHISYIHGHVPSPHTSGHIQVYILVPDIGAGRCLGPEGNGVSLGEGGEGGPRLPGSKEDKLSVLSRGRDNMEKEEEERASRA
jgi:hypothetical protein